MLGLDVTLIVLAVLSVLRVEHLIASDFWIAFRGDAWKRRVSRMSISNKSNVTRMWKTYRDTGGGKLPYLFFGIKSYRLAHESDQAIGRGWRWRSHGLRLLRMSWRFYTFVVAMSSIVILLSIIPARLSETSSIALLIIAFAMVGGMLAVAAEVTLASLVLGSWAVLYQ